MKQEIPVEYIILSLELNLILIILTSKEVFI